MHGFTTPFKIFYQIATTVKGKVCPPIIIEHKEE
jgi:hypothetical protein